MENNRESGKSPGYFFKNVKTKLRLLAGFEFVSAVACSDSNCQGINACSVYEILNLVGLCIGLCAMLYLNVVLYACKCSKLCLDRKSVV